MLSLHTGHIHPLALVFFHFRERADLSAAFWVFTLGRVQVVWQLPQWMRYALVMVPFMPALCS